MSLKIGGGENPFLKKPFEDAGKINGNENNVQKPIGDNPAGGIEKTQGADEIKKPGMEEGAASNNTNANPNAKIDREQFTNEDDIQEIDLQEFEDDFN